VAVIGVPMGDTTGTLVGDDVGEPFDKGAFVETETTIGTAVVDGTAVFEGADVGTLVDAAMGDFVGTLVGVLVLMGEIGALVVTTLPIPIAIAIAIPI
jgi:hypothetical protein